MIQVRLFQAALKKPPKKQELVPLHPWAIFPLPSQFREADSSEPGSQVLPQKNGARNGTWPNPAPPKKWCFFLFFPLRLKKIEHVGGQNFNPQASRSKPPRIQERGEASPQFRAAAPKWALPAAGHGTPSPQARAFSFLFDGGWGEQTVFGDPPSNVQWNLSPDMSAFPSLRVDSGGWFCCFPM